MFAGTEKLGTDAQVLNLRVRTDFRNRTSLVVPIGAARTERYDVWLFHGEGGGS
jgi:hypothetical protein